MADIAQLFDKAYEQQEFAELADAPVEAIQGLSESDAEALKQALGVSTVRELAQNKYVRIAQAVVALAPDGGSYTSEPTGSLAAAGSTSRRKPGSAAGRVLIRENFDAPLPDNLLDSFLGKRAF